MKPEDRYAWLENRIDEEGAGGVDTLNSQFVDDYIDATDAKFRFTNFGAYKCPQLGRDLSTMFRAGRLRRSRLGLTDGAWQPGFPTWVWCYSLPRYHRSTNTTKINKETANGL